MTRRSLFGLIPMPFSAGLSGLLTTSREIAPAPASDPVAVAADEVARSRYGLDYLDGFLARNPDVDRPTHERVVAECLEELARREQTLNAYLARNRRLAVVAGGQVYSADRASRSSVVARPVYVAMLTPAEGGAS
jgi:hypothetical protein